MAYIIESTNFTDEYEPLEEGLLPVIEKRTVSSLRIMLRVGKPGNMTSMPGYMEPKKIDPVTMDSFMKKLEDYNRRREGYQILH
jgi:hypothetical protein